MSRGRSCDSGLVTAERREAEALAGIATTLSILKLGAQVKALES